MSLMNCLGFTYFILDAACLTLLKLFEFYSINFIYCCLWLIWWLISHLAREQQLKIRGLVNTGTFTVLESNPIWKNKIQNVW